MLLLSGQNLKATRVACNLPSLHVTRIQANGGGRYLFVWLKIGADTKSATAVCRIQTPAGVTSFELPLAARTPAAGKFQGLTVDDALYLIMPDRFADGDPTNDQPPLSPGTYDRGKPRAYHGGDLRGIQEHLAYLRDLGVTALWLTPVYDNYNAAPEDYHGYHAVDFYAVDEHLGTLKDLDELVSAAHRHGLKVYLDTVVNHTGPHHPWVQSPPLPHWFHGTPAKHSMARADFEWLTDPHATRQQWRDVVEGWFANFLPDLNQEEPRVAQYLLHNSLWWAEQTGVDGYRLDTFPYVSRHFWADWHRQLRRPFPNLATIGEVSNPDPTVTAFFAGGQTQFDGIDTGLTTPFDFPFCSALRDVIFRNAPVRRLIDVFRQDQLYPRPELLVTFLGNHDIRRFLNEPGGSKDKLKLAFSLLLTVRGIPQLYYGDEIGMQGGEDPDNRRDFPGGFPGDPRNAFTTEGRTGDEQEIFSHVQALLRLRREHSALRRGQHWHLAWDDAMYAFVRESPDERLLVVFNNADQPRNVHLNLQDTPLASNRLLEPLFKAQAAIVHDQQAELQIGPRSVAIYAVK